MKLMKDRIQVYDPVREKWVKINTINNEEMQAKQDGNPFKRVSEFYVLKRKKKARKKKAS